MAAVHPGCLLRRGPSLHGCCQSSSRRVELWGRGNRERLDGCVVARHDQVRARGRRGDRPSRSKARSPGGNQTAPARSRERRRRRASRTAVDGARPDHRRGGKSPGWWCSRAGLGAPTSAVRVAPAVASPPTQQGSTRCSPLPPVASGSKQRRTFGSRAAVRAVARPGWHNGVEGELRRRRLRRRLRVRRPQGRRRDRRPGLSLRRRRLPPRPKAAERDSAGGLASAQVHLAGSDRVPRASRRTGPPGDSWSLIGAHRRKVSTNR